MFTAVLQNHLSPLYSLHLSLDPFYSTFIFFKLYVRLQANSQHRLVSLFSSFETLFSCFLLIEFYNCRFSPSIPAWLNTTKYLSFCSFFSQPISKLAAIINPLCVNLASVCVLGKQIVCVETHFNSLNVRTSDKRFF